jgi:hypothetical protein
LALAARLVEAAPQIGRLRCVGLGLQRPSAQRNGEAPSKRCRAVSHLAPAVNETLTTFSLAAKAEIT